MSDEMVEISLEIPNEVLLKCALAAHELDITLNEFFIRTLQWALEHPEELEGAAKAIEDPPKDVSPQ